MDPALQELLRSADDGDELEVEAIIRLRDPLVAVAGVRLVARFGHIATCRLPRAAIRRVRQDPNVASLKAAKPVAQPEHDPYGTGPPRNLPLRPVPTDLRRPQSVTATGAGVVVGVVDWGCDITKFPRLEALWDQRGPAGPRSPRPYGYGTHYSRSEIDQAVRSPDPYAIGYYPAAAHGTRVMDIAAGSGLTGLTGVAPPLT